MSSIPIPDGENGLSPEQMPFSSVVMKHKRQRELEEDSEKSKRFKEVIGSIADEYVCPITTELPVDPVTAEDGHVYERWAIEKCIQMQGDDIKSPSTNLPMGPRLTPAIRVRNSIRKLINSAAIEGEMASKWNERIKEESKISETKRKAEEGDTDAMCDLGDWHYHGRNGLSLDHNVAYQWYKRAADLHSVRGTAEQALSLSRGQGVEMDKTHGGALMAMAAGMGSDLGAYIMGTSYMRGNDGFPKDVDKAKHWLKAALGGNCSAKHMTEDFVISAKMCLKRLDNEPD